MTDLAPVVAAAAWFDALGRGDVPAALSLLDEQILWHQPGANPLSGDHTGPEAVGHLLARMMEASAGSFRLAVAGPPMSNGDLVAVPVHFAGEREGASMDMNGVDLLRIQGGRIVEVHLFGEDAAAEDAFWATA